MYSNAAEQQPGTGVVGGEFDLLNVFDILGKCCHRAVPLAGFCMLKRFKKKKKSKKHFCFLRQDFSV